MPANKTPARLKIRWNQGGHMFGGVSPLGEYFVSKDRRIVFLPNGGAPVGIEIDNASGDIEADLYWSMVNHNKMLHGIDTHVEDYWRQPR